MVGAVMSMMVVVMQGVLVLPVVIVIGGGRGCDGGGGVWQCLMVDMVGCMCGLWWFVLVRSKSSMCSCCAIGALLLRYRSALLLRIWVVTFVLVILGVVVFWLTF